MFFVCHAFFGLDSRSGEAHPQDISVQEWIMRGMCRRSWEEQQSQSATAKTTAEESKYRWGYIGNRPLPDVASKDGSITWIDEEQDL